MANRGVRDGLAFDKVERVKKHVEASRILDRAVLPRLRNWTPEGTAVAPPLSALRSIELRELELDRTHVGRVLYGTLCVKPFRTYFVQTVVEDITGKAVLLSVYDTVANFRSKYAKGVKLAIKEPWLYQYGGGSIGIRVDNPVNVEDVPSFPEITPSRSTSRKVDSKVNLDVRDPADFLRNEGNNHYAKKDWKKAIEYYSHSIKYVEQVTNPTGHVASTGDGENQDGDKNKTRTNQLMLAYSNRAEAWLQVENHENALSDSTRALELDAAHEKSLLRKGKALHGLKRYMEAISCLEGLLALDTETIAAQRGNIEATLKRARIVDKQVRLGIFDMDYYYRSGCSGTPPECTDYLGPVEIRYVDGPHSAGRGLFLTKDVKEGELLLVSNALAVARAGPGSTEGNQMSDVLEELVRQVINMSRKDHVAWQQLYSLQDSTEPPEGELPPIALFSGQPGGTCEQQELPSLDIPRIRRIVRINAIQGNNTMYSFGYKLNHKRVGAKPEQYFSDDATEAAGLWGLPSFVNHSCSPNSAVRHIGEAIFVTASRDLQKGEEITCALYDVFSPLVMRESTFQARGFRCLCQRCVLERSLVPLVPETGTLAQKYSKYFDKINEAQHDENFMGRAHYMKRFLSVAHQMENILKQNGRIADLDLVKKNWLRASYVFSYLFSTRPIPFVNDSDPNDPVIRPKVVLPSDVILRMMFAVHPGCELTMSLVPDFMPSSTPSEKRIATRMAERVCTCIYGPLRPETMKTIRAAFHGGVDRLF